MRIKDRPEFLQKPVPLTFKREDSAQVAVDAMSKRNVGSVVVTDDNGRLIGVVTERDIMNRLVARRRDPAATSLDEIMTRDVRVAHAEDDLLGWMRMMSNERFRRLPIVDDDGKVISIMTQGDFVSYTWPNLVHQAREVTRSAISRNSQLVLIFGSVMLYTVTLVVILGAFFSAE